MICVPYPATCVIRDVVKNASDKQNAGKKNGLEQKTAVQNATFGRKEKMSLKR